MQQGDGSASADVIIITEAEWMFIYTLCQLFRLTSTVVMYDVMLSTVPPCH